MFAFRTPCVQGREILLRTPVLDMIAAAKFSEQHDGTEQVLPLPAGDAAGPRAAAARTQA